MPWECLLGGKLQLHSVWSSHTTQSSIIYRTSLRAMREGTFATHEHVVRRSLISGHTPLLLPRALDPQHSRVQQRSSTSISHESKSPGGTKVRKMTRQLDPLPRQCGASCQKDVNEGLQPPPPNGPPHHSDYLPQQKYPDTRNSSYRASTKGLMTIVPQEQTCCLRCQSMFEEAHTT